VAPTPRVDKVAKVHITSDILKSPIAVQTTSFEGTDLGLAINQADKALGANPGIIVATPGTIKTQVTISSGHTLHLSSGDFFLSPTDCVLPCVSYTPIMLKDNTSMVGEGPATVIHESDTITANDTGSFRILQPYNVAFDATDRASNIVVKDFQVLGGNTNGYSGIQTTIYLGACHNCSVTGVLLNRTKGLGIGAGGIALPFNHTITNVVSIPGGLTTITVASAPPDHRPFYKGQRVVISGVNGITNVNGWWRISSSPTPASFTISTNNPLPTGTYTSGGIAGAMENADNVTLDYNKFVGVGSTHLFMTNGINFSLSNNQFDPAGTEIGGVGTTFIDIEPNAGFDVVENFTVNGNMMDARMANTFIHGIVLNGGQISSGPGVVSGNTLTGRTFPPWQNATNPSANMVVGIDVLGDMHHVNISGNMIAGGGQVGFSLAGSELTVMNNTIICTGQAIGGAALKNSVISGNVYINSGNCIGGAATVAEDAASSGNLYIGNVNMSYTVQATSKVLNPIDKP
jgi:hypothetical protein